MRIILLAVAALTLSGPLAYADHSWANYHWARTTNNFDLILVNSTTSDWDRYVDVAVSDWSQSSELNFEQDPNGSTTTRDRRKCDAADGQVRICNLAYGQNGWLGIAGISVAQQGHIFRGYTKLNDTYFAWDYYNNDEWKQSVTCQELGHDLGLDHQDENFNNTSLFTCMDYQDPPYPFPNAHDSTSWRRSTVLPTATIPTTRVPGAAVAAVMTAAVAATHRRARAATRPVRRTMPTSAGGSRWGAAARSRHSCASIPTARATWYSLPGRSGTRRAQRSCPSRVGRPAAGITLSAVTQGLKARAASWHHCRLRPPGPQGPAQCRASQGLRWAKTHANC